MLAVGLKMNHYNIIFSTELLHDEDYSSVLHALCKRCEKLQRHKPDISLADYGSHFITIVKPVQDMEDVKPTGQDDLLWTELTQKQDLHDVVVHNVPILENVTELPNSLLLQRIHDLAENIPKIGVILDVYWLVKDETLPSIEENIELYGALKRLLEWNNADFKFLTFVSEVKDNDKAEPWITMLRGHVTTIHDLHTGQSDTLWKGSIQIVGTNIRKPINLPGFKLRDSASYNVDECRELDEISSRLCGADINIKDKTSKVLTQGLLPRLLAAKMEVIAQVDRQDIPLLYYTGQCCQLCIHSDSKLLDKSRQFLQRLEENHRLCYLVKLCYGTSWKCIEDDSWFKDKELKEKKTWSDFVQENIEHVLYCPTLPDLDGELGQHVLLLCANSGDMPSDAGDFSCEAHLIHSPAYLNGSFTHQTIVSSLWKAKTQHQDVENNKISAEKILSELPMLSRQQLIYLQQTIKKSQVALLQAWIDKQTTLGQSSHISSTDLIMLLQSAQFKVITQFRRSILSHHQRISLSESYEDEVKSYQPSVRNLERLVLAYQNQAESRFGRYKSNDSLAGLSPPSRGKVLTLKATEFLKFFKSDGTSTQELASQITLKKCSNRKRCMKLNPDDLKKAWPGCESLQFHDIYYNHGGSESIELKSKRLLSRFQTTETSSTCIYRQAHSPTILAVSTDKWQGHNKEVKITPDRVTRSAKKCKNVDEAITKDSKRLYAAKKIQAESRSKSECNVKRKSDTKMKFESKSEAQQKKESRSQRHKRKLEEIVKETLKKHGVVKEDALFKPCALRLYNITKSFVKDLTSSVGLREEMAKIAESNVQMIVDFEKKNKKKK